MSSMVALEGIREETLSSISVTSLIFCSVDSSCRNSWEPTLYTFAMRFGFCENLGDWSEGCHEGDLA